MDNRTRRPSPVVAVLGGLLLLSSNEACVSPTPPIAAVTPAAQPTPRTLPPQLPRGSRLQPPRLTLTASGPVLIRVTADTAPGEPVNGIRVKRAPETGGQEFFFFGNGFQYEGSHGSAIQYALPDTTYRYRATAVSGRSDLLDSAPSEEVSVRTPSEPDAPPAAPTWLVARAVSPFAIELDWDDRSDNEYGFEVEQRTNEGKFARVALVDPDRPRFVDHNLAPGTEGRYRVRAFNPRGTSPATEEAAARTPPVAEHPTTLEDVAPHPAPCTSREEALRMVDDLGDPEVPVVTRMDLGHGRVADLVEQPSSCGSGGCGLQLYAVYDGCYRSLGDFFATGIQPFVEAPSGWPLLVTTVHCNAGNYTVSTFQLVNGRYVEVDRFMGCSFERALAESRPPFRAECSEDEPCQQPLDAE